MAGKSLHQQLLEGFEVKSRKDGTVHTIRAADGKTVIGEVCVGAKATRLNLRAPVAKPPRDVTLGGKSKSWAGGGTVVTDANVTACRALLSAAVATVPSVAVPTSSAAQRTTTPERKRVGASAKRASRTTAA